MGKSDQQLHSTACNLCFVNCGLKVQLGGEDNREIIKVMGDKEHPVSDGYICNKATRINYYQNNPNRLTSPMRRRPDGTYEEISWDMAISEIAEKLGHIKSTYGGERITLYGGGGQGNHFTSLYFRPLFNGLGMKYRSSPLAQEKTGICWVLGRVIGTSAFYETEAAEVLMFAGKNPFMSHGIDRGRAFLREISKDPARKLIVMDPRRTETTDYADIHLQVKPGRDAWCLSAILGHIVQELELPMDWLQKHTHGYEDVIASMKAVPVAEYAEFCGVDIEVIKEAANVINSAKSFVLEEDIGVQMAPHSTLVSYLNFMTMALNGNYGKPGTMLANTPMVELLPFEYRPTNEQGEEMNMEYTPVTHSPVIAGMYPCTALPDEVLTDHEERLRAAFIVSSNPVHSLPQSDRMAKTIRALELSVVIDVTMTETARQSDYVLPACSQYERHEATFFPMHVPDAYFHVRQPLFDPKPGTLPEAEIYARIMDAMGFFDADELAPLKDAASKGIEEYRKVFFEQIMQNSKVMDMAPYVLYRTMGAALPEGNETTAGVWGLCQTLAMKNPKEVADAGYHSDDPGTEMYNKLMDSPSGAFITHTKAEESFSRIPYPDNKLQLNMKEMLEEIQSLQDMKALVETSEEYPFALVAGVRRSYTANTIIRDPNWIKGKIPFALTMHPDDAEKIGIEEGVTVMLKTEHGQETADVAFDDRMHPGTLSIPNGQGLTFTTEDGETIRPGVFANKLTGLKHRDRFVGTPWHKFVPANITVVA